MTGPGTKHIDLDVTDADSPLRFTGQSVWQQMASNCDVDSHLGEGQMPSEAGASQRCFPASLPFGGRLPVRDLANLPAPARPATAEVVPASTGSPPRGGVLSYRVRAKNLRAPCAACDPGTCRGHEPAARDEPPTE